jgi:hypothetical protein
MPSIGSLCILRGVCVARGQASLWWSKTKKLLDLFRSYIFICIHSKNYNVP